MKKVINAGIGGRNFTVDDDAYARLDSYLILFKSRLSADASAEVMDDLEARIAELFAAEVGNGQRVVDLQLVEKVISQLGMPDGSPMPGVEAPASEEKKIPRRLYRDTDDRRIAGICSGIALYFDVDVVLIRIIMLVALVAGTAGFWLYVILWIAVPKALTAAQKCELRGLAPTAENLSKFTNTKA